VKILLVHNRYQWAGGEDEVFRRERALLTAGGHEVIDYVRDNEEIARYRWAEKATLALRTTWARDSYKAIRSVMKQHKPDVVHFHNTFPLISPAAYYACRKEGVPVVQSLHNPRIFCPASTCYRDLRNCQDCLGKTVPWPSVLHGCYRRSRLQSAVVASMIAVHRVLKSWDRLVDRYVVFTEFYRRKFVEAGLPSAKIVVKPHFVEDCGVQPSAGRYALFIGRLAPEKGLVTLLDAWKRLAHIPLKIRGEGPLLSRVMEASETSAVQLVTRLDRSDLTRLLQGARFLVWPSEGYCETFGCVAAEAFACGVPVIASGIGVMEELVTDGQTGLTFRPGDPGDLAAKVNWAWTHQEEMEAMGRQARKEYEAKYTADRNYTMLMDIYEQAIRTCRADGPLRAEALAT